MKKETKRCFWTLAGFTLIELLVAMAIIGILVTLVSGNYINIKRKGRDVQRKHDLEQMQRALEMYYNDYGEYPDPDSIPAAGVPWEDANGTLYIKTVPPDPRNYAYPYETDNVSYKFFAYLENTQDPDIQACVVSLSKVCDGTESAPGDCNYGVSSVNLDVCEVSYP